MTNTERPNPVLPPKEPDAAERIAQLAVLQRLAQEVERGPLYFIPRDVTPLAHSGVLSTTPPGGVGGTQIPWSVPTALLPLPKPGSATVTSLYWEIDPVLAEGTCTITIRQVVVVEGDDG